MPRSDRWRVLAEQGSHHWQEAVAGLGDAGEAEGDRVGRFGGHWRRRHIEADREVVEVDDQFHEPREQALIKREHVGENADGPVEWHGRQQGREPGASGVELLCQGSRSIGRLLLAYLANPARHRVVQILRRPDAGQEEGDRNCHRGEVLAAAKRGSRRGRFHLWSCHANPNTLGGLRRTRDPLVPQRCRERARTVPR
jgi:hypothetical protein